MNLHLTAAGAHFHTRAHDVPPHAQLYVHMSAGVFVRGLGFVYANRRAISKGAKYAYRGAKSGARRATKFVAGNKRKLAAAGTGAAIYGGGKRRKTNAPPRKPGKAPTRKVGKYGGRFKKGKKGSAKGYKGIKNHVEVYGTCSTKNAVYHGYLTCGGRHLMVRQYCDSLLKAIILKQGVTMNSIVLERFGQANPVGRARRNQTTGRSRIPCGNPVGGSRKLDPRGGGQERCIPRIPYVRRPTPHGPPVLRLTPQGHYIEARRHYEQPRRPTPLDRYPG